MHSPHMSAHVAVGISSMQMIPRVPTVFCDAVAHFVQGYTIGKCKFSPAECHRKYHIFEWRAAVETPVNATFLATPPSNSTDQTAARPIFFSTLDIMTDCDVILIVRSMAPYYLPAIVARAAEFRSAGARRTADVPQHRLSSRH